MAGYTRAVRAWLNGALVDPAQAQVSVFDRGFLFGDGVYEVVRFFGGHGVGITAHIERLRESLRLTRISGFDPTQLAVISRLLLEELGTGDATVYLQITRGTAPTRTHIPAPGMTPTVFAFVAPTPGIESLAAPSVLRARTAVDMRWGYCQIKTTSLMGNVLHVLGDDPTCEEAILHRDGFVSEGTSANVFAVVHGVLVTPPVDAQPPILHGVMRALVLEAAKTEGIAHSVRPLALSELQGAPEVFITGSRRFVGAVSHLDGVARSQAAPGPVAQRVLDSMRRTIDCNIVSAVVSAR